MDMLAIQPLRLDAKEFECPSTLFTHLFLGGEKDDTAYPKAGDTE